MAANKSEVGNYLGGVGFTSGGELLKYYDEGTWTPVVEGDSTAGSYSYSTQSGIYTRIGRELIVKATLAGITTVSAGSGNLKVTGLSSLGLSFVSGVNVGGCILDSFAYGSFYGWCTPYISGTDILFQLSKNNAAAAQLTIAMLTSGSSGIHLTIPITVS